MDKIRQLMIDSGLTEEAATKICGLLESQDTQLKAKHEKLFQERLAKAKKVCMEEVQEHKRELSRRFQIFVEARAKTIDESLRKIAIDKETEAVAKLEKIHGLVEGIEINGQPNSELQAKVLKLEKSNKALRESNEAAVNKANQSVALAEKVLTKNRLLEKTIREGKTNGTTPNGAKPTRIDESRKPSTTPTTPRQTAKGNQNARPVLVEGHGQRHNANGQRTMGPADIAATMSDEL